MKPLPPQEKMISRPTFSLITEDELSSLPDLYEKRKQSGDSAAPSPHAYIQDHRLVPVQAHEYVYGLLEGYHADTKRFFCHVLVSGLHDPDDEGWVPVGSRLIRKKLRKAEGELQKLVDAGLLEKKEHDFVRRKSCEWRIPRHIVQEYSTLTWKSARERKWVNLFNGKPSTKRNKTEHYDENRNPHPELIRQAMDAIPWGYFNDRAAQLHLQELSKEVARLEDLSFQILDLYGEESAEYKKSQEKLQEAVSRYGNDTNCYRTFWSQKPEHVGGDIYRYRMAYRPLAFGRISQIHGGAQNCSRKMKAAIYSGILDLHNYDIQSSQAYILRDEMEKAGFDVTWLDRYLAEDKRVYAERVGLSVKAWKRCFYAVCMGASLPKHILKSAGSLRKQILKDLGDAGLLVDHDPDEEMRRELEATGAPEEVYARFREEVGPFYEELQRFRDYLEAEWVKANSTAGRGGVFIKNETGSLLSWAELSKYPKYKRQARLAAFVLQGKESAFIHKLTVLSAHFGFEVISNEHDGVVTLGAIPSEALEVVRRELEMEYINLPEKAFC